MLVMASHTGAWCARSALTVWPSGLGRWLQMTFEGSPEDQACLAAITKDAHPGAVADVLQDSPWWVPLVLGFFILFHFCFAETLHHR